MKIFKNKMGLVEKRNCYGYLFSLPFIIGFIVFVLVPLISSINISLSKLTVGENGYILEFIGLENYNNAFLVDPTFRQQLVTSVTEMLTSVPITAMFAFFVASILTMEFKGRTVARAILFLPVAISSGIIDNLVSGDYMNNMVLSGGKYSADGLGVGIAGAFIQLISDMQLPTEFVDFLVSSVEGIYSITAMSAVPIVIFMAALQSVPESVYEASYIEGATKWEVFWKIKFPLVSPHILVCVVYCVIDMLNNSSNIVIKAIKSVTYTEFNYGLGTAMSVAYTVIILLILFIVYRLISKRVIYAE